MVTYSKEILSGSNNGKQILITATSGSLTAIHTAVAGSSSFDEVWLYAYNDSTSSINLNVLWGGTIEPYDIIRTVIPSKSGRISIVDGKLLQNALTIQAYADVANVISIDGFVNNIGTVVTSSIHPIVATWAKSVVFNGGALPSTTTQIAMSTFYNNLINSGLILKMQMINCMAPDNATAILTPLIGGRIWDTSGITITSLSTGLNGSGGSSFINTLYNPYRECVHSSSAGFSIYASKLTGSAALYDFGATDSAGNTMFAAMLCNSSISGGAVAVYMFNGSGNFPNGTTFPVKTPGLGFYSANRTNISGSLLSLYYSNSTASLYLLSSGSNSITGSPGLSSALDVNGTYLGAVRLVPSSVFGSVSNTYSFLAMHQGLSQDEARVFSTYVQALRVALGGGFV